ncbi:MAG: carboxypeptidase regulatory-like domain-containing protein [Planctomycetota bacterium]
MKSPRALVAVAALLGLLVLVVVWARRESAPSAPPAAPDAIVSAPGDPAGTADDADRRAATAADAAAADRVDQDRTALDLDPDAPHCTVRGLVLADPRMPIAGVEVLAYRGRAGESADLMSLMTRAQGGRAVRDDDVPFLATGDVLARAVVAADGTFELHTRERHLRLRLEHRFYGLGVPEVVHVPPTTDTAFAVLQPYLGGCLRGRVLGALADRARTVQLVPEPDPMAAARDPSAFMATVLAAATSEGVPIEDAQFEFRAVPVGVQLVLLATGDGVGARGAQLPMAPAELREVGLGLQETHSLTVEVVDEDGAPLADIAVRAHPDADRSPMGMHRGARTARTDADGRALLTGLLAGGYDVRAGGAGFVRAEAHTETPTEQTVRLVLGRGGMVRGVVVDRDGAPVAGAKVAPIESMKIPLFGDVTDEIGLDLLGLATEDGVTTDAEGRFTITGIDGDAPFHVVGVAEGYAPGIARDVTAGADDVAVTLAPAATLALRVVADEDDTPLADYTVELSTRMFLVIDRPVRTLPVQDTFDGRAQLEGLAAGSFSMTVRADGRGRVTNSVTLVAGEHLDAGEVRLPRGASVSGRVIDEQGRPIAGAAVQQSRGGMLDNPALALLQGAAQTVRTGADGAFTLPDLSPGRLVLAASARAFADGKSERLELQPAQQLAGVEIVLDHGGSVAGVLHTRADDRAEEFHLMVQNEVTQASTGCTPAADGSFRVDNLPPGRYQVQAMHPSATDAVMRGQRSGGDLSPGREFDMGAMISKITENLVVQRCTVRAGEVAEVELDATELGAGLRVALQVTVGGEPLTGGIVEATLLADGRVRTGFLDDAGRTTLGALRPGTLRVQVRAGMTMAPVGRPQSIELPEGTDRHRATVALPGGQLSGRVVDRDSGEPLSAVLVRLLRDDEDTQGMFGMAITDGDGAFTFRGLVPDTYGLVAADALVRRSADGAASRVDGIAVGDGEHREGIVLRAQPAAGARVRVTDADGAPLPGATVLAVDDEGRPLGNFAMGVSGPDGTAALGGLPGGRIRFVGRAAGHAPGASSAFTVLAGQSLDVPLRLERGTRVALETLGRDGLPLVGIDVRARCNGGPWFPAMVLIEAHTRGGRLELGRLAPGDWEFRIEHSATGAFSVRRAIPDGAAVTILATPPD